MEAIIISILNPQIQANWVLQRIGEKFGLNSQMWVC